MKHRKMALLGTLAAVVFAAGATAQKQDVPENPEKNVAARIVVLMNSQRPTLAFELFNNTEKPITTIPLGTPLNRIEIETQKGIKREIFNYLSGTSGRDLLVVLEPGQSERWTIDFPTKIGLYKTLHEQNGAFQLRCKVKGLDFDEVVSAPVNLE